MERLQQLAEKESLSNAEMAEAGKLEESVAAGREEKHASMDEADSAAKKASEIEKRLIRETRTELENEVSDIRELRDEYKTLIQTMLSYKKSKKEKDLERIADLEGRLADADATAERRIKTAEAKAKRKFDKEIAGLQEGFDQTAEDIERRRSEGETDRRVEDALKEDAAKGMQMLNELILQSKDAAAAAKDEFRKALAEAQEDGDISEDEEKRARKSQDAYSLAESLVDKYESKLRSAQEATAKQTLIAKPQGAFYAAAAQNLRGSQMEQRMLTATQEIVKHTKKTAELLKDGGNGGTLVFQ